MNSELATIVATVELPEGVTPADLQAAVEQALAGLRARLVPCGWAPDPDTIGDVMGARSVTVVDLNPDPAEV
ncbi:hypothetical protein AB0K09_00595 [Streptomyces sp. NPDC049577]|uniref:hypothetical protein n=1 Tax=Streptomyces sp. NPDC049577 TaxID=3155153 RepID=UPI00341CBA0E